MKKMKVVSLVLFVSLSLLAVYSVWKTATQSSPIYGIALRIDGKPYLLGPRSWDCADGQCQITGFDSLSIAYTEGTEGDPFAGKCTVLAGATSLNCHWHADHFYSRWGKGVLPVLSIQPSAPLSLVERTYLQLTNRWALLGLGEQWHWMGLLLVLTLLGMMMITKKELPIWQWGVRFVLIFPLTWFFMLVFTLYGIILD